MTMMMINKQAYHRNGREGGMLSCSVKQSQKPVISNAQLPRFHFTAFCGPLSFLINSAVILDNRKNSLNQWAWIYKQENEYGVGPHRNFLNESIELSHWLSFFPPKNNVKRLLTLLQNHYLRRVRVAAGASET